MASAVGSPNYGYRSVVRDLEANFLLVTRDPALRQASALQEKNLATSWGCPSHVSASSHSCRAACTTQTLLWGRQGARGILPVTRMEEAGCERGGHAFEPLSPCLV